MNDEGGQHPFETLEGRRFARLTTFRKSGQPVSSPVRFVLVGDRVFTQIESGKMKRVRDDPRVLLAPADFRGRPRGENARVEARIMDRAECEIAGRALREKYGWPYGLVQAAIRLRGKPARRAFLELRPVANEGWEPAAVSRQPVRYSDITVHAKNPIKSHLQQRRLRDALSALGALNERFGGKFLDFGAGNGELTKALAERFPRAKVFCYEPAPVLFEEARQNLAGLENVVLVSSLDELKGLKFRYAFCLEVFEHLPPRETRRAIKAINRLLSNTGIAVVGVPNELFLPALLKGLFRMSSRYGAYDARFANVFKAAIGRPPGKRPVREIAPGLPYHFQHTGFDHRKLRRKLSETFEVVRQFGSPVGSEWLSAEIYLVLKKRDKASGLDPANPDSSSDQRAPELYERPPREPE